MKEQVTVITGGSRGIGRATSLLLAQKGHKVCINYHQNHEQAKAVLWEIEQLGGTAIAIQADVADEAQVVAMFAEVDRRLGTITGLVNNAGILMTQSSVIDLSAERINSILATNVTGSFLCAREAIKRMSTQNAGAGGAIVNVSSAAARLGSPNEYVDYAASKGALDSFTRGLSLEVASFGIRVNSVRPGFIYTEMHADGGEANRVDRVSASLPMKRGGYPIEVAQAIAWLLSEEASYVTGSFLELAGGK